MLLLKEILSMTVPLRLATITAILSLSINPSLAQTTSSCNPLLRSGCPADPALGTSTTIDFRDSKAEAGFATTGYPTYGPEGISFAVAQSGDSPMLVSNWYIMFGKYEITMKAAPGRGIVSSVVLQSDDLDEIDWEWVGVQNNQAQTNYFGKGQTTTYDRGGFSSVSDSQNQFHTYGVEWTPTQITWSVDGTAVRTLLAKDADGQFPQTPCQLRFGIWSGGDPSNAPGVITWAGGSTDYSAGPYTMTVQSVAVTDYSSGSSYSYGDSTGSWQSIEASGGTVNGNAGASFADSSSHVSGPSRVTGSSEIIGPSASGNPFVLSGSSAPSLSAPASWQPAPSQVASWSAQVSSHLLEKRAPVTVPASQPSGTNNIPRRVAEVWQSSTPTTSALPLHPTIIVPNPSPRPNKPGDEDDEFTQFAQRGASSSAAILRATAGNLALISILGSTIAALAFVS